MKRLRLPVMPSTLRHRSARFDRPTRPFRVVTGDRVSLVGDRLGEGPVALVFCHGFRGWHRKPRLLRFQERLPERQAWLSFHTAMAQASRRLQQAIAWAHHAVPDRT